MTYTASDRDSYPGGILDRRTQLVVVIALSAALVAGCTSNGPSGSGEPTTATGVTSPAATSAASATPSALVTFGGVEESRVVPKGQTLGYMDAGPDGLVYVPNSTSGEVLVLNTAGRVVRRWGLTETGKRQLDCWRNPSSRKDDLCGVAITEDGTAFVAESGADRVSRFPTGGERDLTWGTSGTKDGAFQEPIGVDVGPDGRVYVVDDLRDDIQVFSADGAYVRTIGTHGTEPGQMSFTGMVRVRDDGMVVNADFANSRVQAFSPAGKLQWWFGSYGSGSGEFVEPQDIAFGPGGLLFVMDAGRVQVFDRSHELVGVWPADSEWDAHLGSIALVGNSLWVEPSYTGTVLRVPVSYS